MRRGWGAAGLAGMLASLAFAAPAPALQFQPAFRMSNAGPDGDTTRGVLNPAVAYAPAAGGRFLLLYKADAGTTNDEQEIWSRAFDGGGAPLGPAIQLSSAGTDGLTTPNADFPSVEFNPVSGEFMAVWQERDDAGGLEVWFSRIGVDGTPVDLGGAGGDLAVRISDDFAGADLSYGPDLAVNPGTGEALVAFSDFRAMADGGDGDGHDDIRVQLVSAAGAEIPDTTDDEVSDQAGSGESIAPDVVFNAELGRYGLVWDDTVGGLFEDLDATGAETGADEVPYVNGLHVAPSVASAGTAGWQVGAVTAAVTSSVVRIAADGATPGALSAGLSGISDITVLSRSTAGGYLLTGTGTGPRAVELDSGGTVLGAPVSAGITGGPTGNPAVTFDTAGNRWLVAASANVAGELDVYGAFTGPAAPAPPTEPPPPAAGPAPAAAPPAAPKPKPIALTTVATLPSARTCVSRRNFRIRLREPSGVEIAEARVFVNGRRVKVVKGVRKTANVDLRGLPKGRFTVKIDLRTADGRTVRGTRRYRTCAPKRR